ncbi:MAG TPA: signal peptide peptidase SppA [Candidatus Binatia bacterium]|nr:signal peptide peptidase SppA [Candidatus Binatia bacterium]
MARRHPILRGLAVLAAVAAGLIVVAALAARLGARGWISGPRVGVAELQGVLRDGDTLEETLEDFRKEPSTVAVVLRVDSPGGAVAPAQELYEEVWRVRREKPVVASFGNVAASAAYYVASAADAIVADPGTLTGSIGAIMELVDASALADKVGLKDAVVKSGPFKDVGQPLRPMTDEDRRLLQSMVDDVLGQFVAAVARGRAMPPERVRALADGRPYSGAQAQAVGLVDQLGSLDVAERLAWERAGRTGEPRVTRVRARRWPWWLAYLTESAAPAPRGLPGGLLLLYPGALPR